MREKLNKGGRPAKPNITKMTLSIDEELLKNVKHLAIDQGVSASSLIEDAVREYFDRKGERD